MGADVVVNNYSFDVLPGLGLCYDVLKQLNRQLVTMSTPAFGADSMHRDCRANGSTLEQGSGLPSVIGRPNGPPTMSHTAFGDAVGGLNGCAAVLVVRFTPGTPGRGNSSIWRG
nr:MULTISPECIES: CoA transferase [unclassified Bradyrhizobium]